MSENNVQLLERLEQCHGAKIDSLHWIICSGESFDFLDFVDEIDQSIFNKLFPENKDEFDEFKKDPICFLMENDKLGFLARFSIPFIDDVVFDKRGNPSRWVVNNSVSKFYYIYAESTEDLVSQMETISQNRFQEMIEECRSKSKASKA